MTLLAAWVGVDAKKNGPKVASIYFATDSRISWPNGDVFDQSTKSFAMANHPDIFGYCGDVLFPTIAISQIIQRADAMMLFPNDALPFDKAKIIQGKLREAIANYPKHQTAGSFIILYASRDANNNFYCYSFEWNLKDGLSMKNLVLPDHSNVVSVLGSGTKEFSTRFNADFNHPKYNNFGTSRTVYHCFTDTMRNMADPKCGGAPQIVGLYRIGNGINYGIIDKGKKFLGGSEVGPEEFSKFVEWRNENFERVDPKTMQIFGSAQRQPKI